MNVFKSIIFCITGILCSSCSDNRTIVQSKPIVSSEIKFISSDKNMVKIPGGSYESFIGKDSGRVVTVQPFYIDETPVTQQEYLQFLKANPQWSKSNVLKIYSDSTYLKSWESDFQIPKGTSPNAPVTNVSWFSAEAYAKSVGKRLPTIDEWEFVGLADQHQKNASNEPAFSEAILKAYQDHSIKNQSVKNGNPNYYGVYDIYGLIWEWTYDFNSVMMSGESRKDNSVNESLFCAGAAVTSSDLRNYAAFVRYALRGSLKANYTLNNLGFRCAKDLKN